MEAARCLEPHHKAWLSAHDERDADWLRGKLKEGFDVHHLDCDHSNNAPENLVLIDHIDHMRLHGFPNSDRLRRKTKNNAKAESKKSAKNSRDAVKVEYCKLCYEKAASTILTWNQVAQQLGLRSGKTAMQWAKTYAQQSGQPWPLGLRNSL